MITFKTQFKKWKKGNKGSVKNGIIPPKCKRDLTMLKRDDLWRIYSQNNPKTKLAVNVSFLLRWPFILYLVTNLHVHVVYC